MASNNLNTLNDLEKLDHILDIHTLLEKLDLLTISNTFILALLIGTPLVFVLHWLKHKDKQTGFAKSLFFTVFMASFSALFLVSSKMEEITYSEDTQVYSVMVEETLAKKENKDLIDTMLDKNKELFYQCITKPEMTNESLSIGLTTGSQLGFYTKESKIISYTKFGLYHCFKENGLFNEKELKLQKMVEDLKAKH